MKLQKIFRRALLGVVLLCAAATVAAMTVGRARGEVLLGQPLKVSAPIQLELGEGQTDLCFEAEVFYGDTRQDASRVKVSNDHSPPALLANVYVSSIANVDEPVITVYLRYGCALKSTRRFVLLADLASEALPSEPRPIAMPKPLPPAVVSQRQPISVDRAIGEPVVKKLRPVESEMASVAGAPVRPVSKKGPTRGAYLKLLPIDLTEERDPVLKLSSELYLGESEDLQKRSEAAALWKALNATPQDILLADGRRRSMEEDLKGLQLATTKNSKTLEELSGQLNSAETQRYANPLVYGLAALLMLCSLGLGYVLLRIRQGGLATSPWWGGDGFTDKSDPLHSDEGEHDVRMSNSRGKVGTAEAEAEGLSKSVAGKPPSTLTEVDIDLFLDEPSLSNERKASNEGAAGVLPPSLDSTSRAAGHADFAHSMTANMRALSTKEMLDVRQQADFFMTLGQHEEALGLLKECVDVSAESNPLVYLDLLRILHTLGQKAEFDHYRSDFNMLFSGHVPSYAAFNQGGQGLDAYPEICESVVAFWPSERAVDYIEACLVREAEDGSIQEMDLEAFRDLLMLHGMAKRMASGSDSGFLPFSAAKGNSEQGATYRSDGGGFDSTKGAQQGHVDGINIANMHQDFDLTKAPANLIDFDASEFSQQDQGPARKP